MTIIPIRVASFDDAATLAMGEAFDRACKTLRNIGSAVREITANRIIELAKNGERDPDRLYEQALKTFVGRVGRDPLIPAYALVRHAA
ncbi:MAG TPA: hypothetical protein VFJ59_16340 [Pseudolabrys sp.]|jgi:hypothetical protein|nr:hypothetical protein [Pseudolabrys sp.]